VRVNAQKTLKPAAMVKPGDTLTIARADRVHVVRILAIAARRGSAIDAAILYDEPDPPVVTAKTTAHEGRIAAPRYDGGGRPSRKDRRAKSDFERSSLE